MFSENLTDWIAILISVAALAWTVTETSLTRKRLRVQEKRGEAQREQLEYRSLLDNFLLPMCTSLARSREGFLSLKRGLHPQMHFEYYPQRLREFFEQLSDDRRVFWRVEIGLLHEHNQQTIRLIDSYASGSRLSPGFQKGCEDFRRHATTWKAMWDAIADLTIPPSGLPGGEIAEPFPTDFDRIVRDEAERVRSQAGLTEIRLPK